MEKEYMVSVVTPLHNTDMKYFKKCFDSVLNQTIGFENIEWIIVVHNSLPEICDRVLQMAEPYPNIIVDILNNDAHTPSSPRNRGMELAHAPYIGFLDADDSYTLNCMEDVLPQIRQTKSQIVTFRRSYEMEDRNGIVITELTMFNQTYPSIILERSSWTHEDQVKMFTGLCGMVTSRIYDFQFLKENNLYFDEDILFGEDFYFNINAYGKVERVCYLPQTIGYHYYINGGSLVQSSAKNGRMLIAIAKGFKKIFDQGLGSGFYMDAIFARLCRILARFIAGSDDITMEERREIKQIMEPYILRTPMLHVNKVYSEREIHEQVEFPRAVILNEENWGKLKIQDLLLNTFGGHDAQFSTQQQVLLDILNLESSTDLGQRYQLSGIYTTVDFQKNVALSSKDDYERYIALTTKIGESGIFTKNKIIGYCFAMDKQNKTVLYPFTERHLETYKDLLQQTLQNECTCLMLDSSYRAKDFNDSTQSWSLPRLLFNEFYVKEKRGRYLLENSGVSADLMLLDEYEQSGYLRILLALSNENITQILASNAAWFRMQMMLIKKECNFYINDIKSGKIRGRQAMSPVAKKLLGSFFRANPKRASVLREAFLCSSMEETLLKIWPGLRQIVFMNGNRHDSGFAMLKAAMKEIKVKYGPVLSEAAPFAIPEGNGEEFRLNLSAAFYEFIPMDHTDERPSLAYELIEGRKYRMVITNYAGLLRYVTDEIIEFRRYGKDRDIIFTFDRSRDVIVFREREIPLEAINRILVLLQKELSVSFIYTAVSTLYDELTFFIETDQEQIPDHRKVSDIENRISCLIASEINEEIQCRVIRLQQETMILYSELKADNDEISEEITAPPDVIRLESDYTFLKAFKEPEK